MIRRVCFFLFLAVWTIGPLQAQRRGSAERIKVHGTGLENNLAGDSPDREVSVYLPPSYKTEPNRRYPVLYLLHGFTDSDEKWYGFTNHWINLPEVVNQSFSNPEIKEMIIVTPNANTKFFGSFYSNSVTTGNWEDFVAKELVSYIDGHYRTIAKPASRGLSGHSMGGYGTMRIGEKYPDVFTSIYLISPCCLNVSLGVPKNDDAQTKLESVRSFEDLTKADFMTKATYALAAAWSPNPNKSPLYLDLPFQQGRTEPGILAKWTANAPLAGIDQYIPNLKKLKAIGFDAGTKDKEIAASIKVLDGILNTYKIGHSYEEYDGDHVNKVGERIQKNVLPFFSKNLSFQQ